MQVRRGVSLLILALLVALSVALVNLAFNLSRVVFPVGPGSPEGSGLSLRLGANLVFYTVVGISLGGSAVLLGLLLWARPSLRRFPLEVLIPLAMVAVTLLGLALLVTPAEEANPPPEDDAGTSEGGPSGGEAEAPFQHLRRFLPLPQGAVGLLLVLGIFAAVYLLLLVGRSRRTSALQALLGEDLDRESRQELAETVERSIYRLELGEDVRSVVLQAYREMVEVFHAHGVDATRHLTARELEELVRSRLGLTGGAAAALRELFEQARYSPHELSGAARTTALTSLRQVKGELGV